MEYYIHAPVAVEECNGMHVLQHDNQNSRHSVAARSTNGGEKGMLQALTGTEWP